MDERRPVAVLFADLEGYTRWVREEDPEEVEAVMAELKSNASEIVQSYGGTVNAFEGDALMALFGLPQGHEDDSRRAVDAALALHAFVRAFKTATDSPRRALRFHSGVDTGLVVARLKDGRDGLFAVTGSAVNTAAHASAAAQSDEILVSDATWDACVGHFIAEPLPSERTAKSDLGRLHRVIRRNERSQEQPRKGLTPFVNRQHEMGELESAWANVQCGGACTVALVGAPGIGKSRVLYELRRYVRKQAGFVLRGRCYAYGNALPYRPFVESVAGLLGLRVDSLKREDVGRAVAGLARLGSELEPHLPVYLHLLSLESSDHPLPSSLGGEPLRQAVVSALAILWRVLAADKALLVLLDDWHWSDDGSRALLEQLVGELREHRVLVVVGYRPEELPPEHEPALAHRLHLEALPDEHCYVLAAAALGANRVSASVRKFVCDRAGGNPLFAEEVCRSMLERGSVRVRGSYCAAHGDLRQVAYPANVQAIVRARMDRLQPEDKETLRLASVIGLEFSDAILSAALPELSPETLTAQLARLTSTGLVYPKAGDARGSYRFRHPIVHEVAYQTLRLRRRADVHARIARRIEQQSGTDSLAQDIEALAYHFHAGKQNSKALHYCELAGDKAARTYALEQAQTLYGMALGHLGALTQNWQTKRRHVDVSLKWAATCAFNPAPCQVKALGGACRVARELSYMQGLARCVSWMGFIESVLGDQQSAVVHHRQSLELGRELADDRLVAQAHANIGICYTMACRHDSALEQFACAEQLWDAAQDSARQRRMQRGGGRGRIYSLGYRALVAGDRGDFDAAYACLERAYGDAQREGLLSLSGSILVQRGMVQSWQGAWTECIQTAREARQVGERIRGGYIRAMSGTLEGYARVVGQGDEGALSQLREAVYWLEERGQLLTMSWNYACLAEALAFRRRAAPAEAMARAALERQHAWDSLGEVAAHRALGSVAALRSAHLEAVEGSMRRAVGAAKAKGSPRDLAISRLRWAQLLTDLGQSIEASALELTLCRFEQMGMWWYSEQARRLLV